jgi:hypothetical protein
MCLCLSRDSPPDCTTCLGHKLNGCWATGAGCWAKGTIGVAGEVVKFASPTQSAEAAPASSGSEFGLGSKSCKMRAHASHNTAAEIASHVKEPMATCTSSRTALSNWRRHTPRLSTYF